MKSFLEACDSLCKDYKTSAVVHLKNSSGSSMTCTIEGYMKDANVQKQWEMVAVSVSQPVVVEKPKLSSTKKPGEEV